MRYKVGQNVVWIRDKEVFVITSIDKTKLDPYSVLSLSRNYTDRFSDGCIDHEATAKRTLPQPSKDMLRSGMKIVDREGKESFVLMENVNRSYSINGVVETNLTGDSPYNKNLLNTFIKRFDIMQIWDGDTLIAQRTEKSEAELKKEDIHKQIQELSSTINVSVKQLDKLKEEIKSL